MKTLKALGLSCILISGFGNAQTATEQQTIPADLTAETFAACLPELSQKAKQAGIDDSTIARGLSNAQFIPNVIKYDRNQPEFVRTFPNYISKRVTDWRINKGRDLLAKHKDLLQDLYEEYGIPQRYIVAFWGLETNFGGIKGKMPIIDSLATLACDYRRSEFFTKELIHSLELMQREALPKEQMIGSWAGAMGHTQFMPSAYLQYAKDGDNDGKVDLWNSVPDALTSAAHFLKNLGWQAGYRWGREVILPEGFDYSLIGRDKSKTLAQWSELGVSRTNGASLGNSDLKSSLLLPAGHKGPAFVVYKNFDVIMRWNFSEFYAISVGYLADRLTGAGHFSVPLPDLPNYSIAQVKDLQMKLNQLGFDVGTADGIMGPATRRGIQGFQSANEFIADGFPAPELFDAVSEAANSSSVL
ncbi:MAG: lytic murein transglycosylase [Alteromonadaceae bacterium]|nr:lytic murein transglycosylase [Alteromonadaceae bacterium]